MTFGSACFLRMKLQALKVGISLGTVVLPTHQNTPAAGQNKTKKTKRLYQTLSYQVNWLGIAAAVST